MTQTAVRTNPFPGLRPFNEDETYLFFGRESQIDDLVEKLSVNRFLAVVGASGSGKSSLVNCGLFPALHGGYMSAAGSSWRIAKFRPGNDPVREMALAMAEKDVIFGQDKIGQVPLSSIIQTNLQRSKLGLIETYKQARLSSNVNLLIVVDQFEELFRFRKIRKLGTKQADTYLDNAYAFVNLLLAATQQTAFPIYVVITMRSDFLGDCSTLRGLPEAINKGQYLVPRMKRKEREKAISGPIEVAGARISDRLLMRLVNDVGDNPDQLSILQHALNRTWAEWEKTGDGDHPIDLEHYNKIGTMSEALDQHANRAYNELKTPRAQYVCEKMFKALTDVGVESRGIRRPTPLVALCEIIDATEEEVTEVIEVFRKPSRSFLMPPAGTELDKDSIIDISHESFMRIWKKLIKWNEEEQDSMRTYRRLSDTATLYNEGISSSLLDVTYLRFALLWKKSQKPNAAWASRFDDNFEVAIGYLQKSKDKWEQEERQKKARIEKEQRVKEEKARRKKLVIRWLLGSAFATALVIVASLGYLLIKEKEKSRLLADANNVETLILWVQEDLNRAREMMKKNPTRAMRINHSAILNLQSTKTPLLVFKDSSKYRFNDTFKDEKYKELKDDYISITKAFKAHLDSITNDAYKAYYPKYKNQYYPDTMLTKMPFVNGVQPDPSDSSSFRGWQGNTSIVNAIWVDSAFQVVFPKDSSAMVLYKSGKAGYYGSKGYKPINLKKIGDGVRITSIAPIQYKEIGHKMLSVLDDNSIVEWNLNGTVRLSPTTVINDTVRAGTNAIYKLGPRKKLNNVITSIAISPDRAKIFTASSEGLGIVWFTDTIQVKIQDNEEIQFFLAQDSVISSAFSNDGTKIVTGATDGTVKIWSAEKGNDVKAIKELNGHTGAVNSVAFSAEDTFIYTGSLDGTYKRWYISADSTGNEQELSLVLEFDDLIDGL